MVSARKQLKSTVSDDSGQSLPLLLFMLTVIIVVCAFAVDAGAWMVHHHEAQVSADSAALAAANCLANPGTTSLNVSGQTVPNCSSSTDTSDAQNVAIAYAAANGVSIGSGDVAFDTTKGTVTVRATVNSGGAFAGFFGLSSTSQSARAVATYKPSVKIPCGTTGSNCDFMYANSSSCASGSYAVNLTIQGSSTLNGNIVTNGNMEAGQTGSAGGVNGSGNVGPGCTSTLFKPNGNGNGQPKDPWLKGDPTPEVATSTWPTDYSKDFPAVSSGYPSACTITGANFSFTATNLPSPKNIYCASGTGAPNTPSTWNGSITFVMSSNNQIVDDSFVAGTISYTGTGSDQFTACGFTTTGYSSGDCNATVAPVTTNYPLFYALASDPSGSAALSIPSSNGSLSFSGDIFVPNGTANVTMSGNQSTYSFFEANAIVANLSGNFYGDGPAYGSGTGGNISGSDSLIQ